MLVKQLDYRREETRLVSNLHRDTPTDVVREVRNHGSPTASEIRGGLEWLEATANPGDFVVLFIAGHGEVGESQELSFICEDGQRLPASELIESLARMPNVVKLVIIDSCFSGVSEDALESA